MRQSLIMKRLAAGQPALVATQCTPIPWFARFAKEYGYDGVWLETEHHLWDNREIQAYLSIHQSCDIDCMVRPASRTYSEAYRLLDNGATGLMIPHVETPQEARNYADSVKFHPLGNRGVDGYGPDTQFGLEMPNDYYEFSNRERFLCVMLESPEAIQQAGEIAAVPGVDLLFLGPADILSRMGVPIDFDHPAYLEIQQHVAEATRAHGKAWGCPCPTPDTAERALETGAGMLVMGSDFHFIRDGLAKSASDFRSCLKQPPS